MNTCLGKLVLNVNSLTTSKIKLMDVNQLKSRFIHIDSENCQMYDFGGFISPAVVVPFKSNVLDKLIVKSHVVKSKDKQLFLFYPVITVLSEDAKVISEVLPLYEFDFERNVLTNTFLLPPNSEYVLIHTKPEFTGMEFEESLGGGGNNSIGLTVGLAVIAGPVGGAIGGAIAASSGGGSAGEFIFSNAGSIRLDW